MVWFCGTERELRDVARDGVNARQKKDSRLSELVTKLLADEQVGKKERLNMWQWGDAGNEEDEMLDVGGMRRRT